MVKDGSENFIRTTSPLPRAPEGWLESKLSCLGEVAYILGKVDTAEEVMRMVVLLARERLGFGRIGSWFFEDGGKVAVGSFGTWFQGTPGPML